MRSCILEKLIFPSLVFLSIAFPDIGCLGRLNFATAETDFPYAAFVAKSSTSVMSGPDVKFYATSRLKWGSRVDVYRHDGEWAAIRPPEGSFSWVPLDAVAPTDDASIMKVAKSQTKTRIGSEFSDKHDSEYIRLRFGELLEVLGQQDFADQDGQTTTWCKIAPPAGEFRWVRLSALSRQPPTRKLRLEIDDTLPRVNDDASPPDLAASDTPDSTSGISAIAEVAGEAQVDLGVAVSPPSAAKIGIRPTNEAPSPTPARAVPAKSERIPRPQGQITTLSELVQPLGTAVGAAAPATSLLQANASPSTSDAEQVQWSYDSSPRTQADLVRQRKQLDKYSQLPARDAGATWREVSSFGEQPWRVYRPKSWLRVVRRLLPGRSTLPFHCLPMIRV